MSGGVGGSEVDSKPSSAVHVSNPYPSPRLPALPLSSLPPSSCCVTSFISFLSLSVRIRSLECTIFNFWFLFDAFARNKSFYQCYCSYILGLIWNNINKHVIPHQYTLLHKKIKRVNNVLLYFEAILYK